MIKELGGNVGAYRHQREQTAKRTVSEVHSRPRVAAAAKLFRGYKVLPGFSLDLTTCKESGEPRDFTKAADRDEARKLLRHEKPMLLIGSPPCTEFSTWQNLNRERYEWSEGEIQRRRLRGKVRLDFVSELYKDQINEGRYFLHEHPDHATSWAERCI